MTIDEAIEILERECYAHHSFPTDIIGKAEKLGIEALKRIQYIRLHHTDQVDTELLEETKE